MSFLSARVARARLTASAAATQRVRELRAAGLHVLAQRLCALISAQR